ncbi:hypothetical protein DRQ50_13050 [bacterium]|nr:MAG: hypothetical protein DRQ50_13050 [bacterium]
MNQNWVDAKAIRGDATGDIWAVDFTAHPLLDPEFPRQRSRLLYLTRLTFRRIMEDDAAYREELAKLFHPPGSPQATEETISALATRAAEYLKEADIYLASTIDLLPEASRNHVVPLPQVVACNDTRELMALAFHGDNERLCYEARRKLFLSQLLLHIDQSRLVQDGPRHLDVFESLLEGGLWCHRRQVHDLSIGFRIGPDGQGIEYTSRPQDGDQRWDFRSTFLERSLGRRRIGVDVLYHSCRFKRSVTPVSFEIVDGRHRVLEKIRWSEMRQQSSGSILSKMIRNGITNPNKIGDIIGAMFIVLDNEALNDLLVLLDSCVGSPFSWRDVTDTLAPVPGGSALNTWSSKGFKVFKGDVDVLTKAPQSGITYRFPVEVQIFTLESYLRTVCGTHEASHLALKLRQFLYGLVPRLFPAGVYGKEWLAGEATGGSAAAARD